MSLKKFTHILFIKKWCQIKKKKLTNNYTKKSNHPKIFIKIKKNVPKKITSSKNKINYDAQALKNQKKKN